LGLGKMVVEGGETVLFCPKYPTHLDIFSSVKKTLQNSQKSFYALDMTCDIQETAEKEDYFVKNFDLQAAEHDGTLNLVASTHSPENDMIYDGISRNGVRLVTFAPILKNKLFPLNEILELLLDMGSRGMGTPVAIEFAVDVAKAGPRRIPQPNDYEIVFDDTNISTGFSNNLPLPFTVTNLTQANQRIDVFVTDLNRDGKWNINEAIIFLDNVAGVLTASWQVTLVDNGSVPGTGDVFYIKTSKPFASSDTFGFSTLAASTDSELAKTELRDIYVVPNPYVGTNELEPRNPVSRSERGDRRLYFANVPRKCTIRIYTLAGELVDTIYHDSTLDDGKAFWDLRTKDNMNIAYGLYIFQVESEEGSFIGKFAVIK